MSTMKSFVLIFLCFADQIFAVKSAKKSGIRDLSDDSKNSLLLLLVREVNRLEAKQIEIQKLLNTKNNVNDGLIEKVSRLESKIDNLQREASSCTLATCMDTIMMKLRNDLDAIAIRLNQSTLYNYQMGSCSSGWQKFDGHCYYFEEKRESWDDAKVFFKTSCQSKGAYSVTVDNEAENKWLVSNNIVISTWIGANDKNLEGTFTWVSDNSALRFAKWAPGEPNDTHRNEDCAYVYPPDGFWNDYPCGNKFPYICEK